MAIVIWNWKNDECEPFVLDFNDMDSDLGNEIDNLDFKSIKTIFKAGDEFDYFHKSKWVTK